MTVRDAGSERAVTLDVTILGREYKVACKDNERTELTEAVAYLDKQMREIRGNGKVAGSDRIAVMAALNIAHELLRERRTPAAVAMPAAAPDAAASERRIKAMGNAIDQLLASQDKLF